MGPTVLEEVEKQFLFCIRRMLRGLEIRSQELRLTAQLTGAQLAVMRAIESGRSGSASCLARQLNLSQPTVSGIPTRLRQRHLIASGPPGPDRRIRRYRLTPGGEKLLEMAPSLLCKRFVESLYSMQDWERLQITHCLAKIAELIHQPEPARM